MTSNTDIPYLPAQPWRLDELGFVRDAEDRIIVDTRPVSSEGDVRPTTTAAEQAAMADAILALPLLLKTLPICARMLERLLGPGTLMTSALTFALREAMPSSYSFLLRPPPTEQTTEDSSAVPAPAPEAAP